MPPSIQAQAANAARQGQQMLNQDQAQAAQSKAQYGTYQGQADAANQQVKDYTNYMAGAGSGGNQYHNELGSQLSQLGYDPQQMTAARNNLNQATGALSAYSDFANQAASKFGLNAGGFAAANSGALSGLNNNIAAQQGVVNGLSSLYGQAQTGANQFAGQQVESEKNTLAGYQKVYDNASNARDQAAQMMQFYNDLARQQGGLNAQQQANYAAASQSYAQAGQAAAQAAYLASQTAGQNLTNQQTQAAMDAATAKNNAKASQNATRNAENAGFEVSSSNANKGLTRALNSGAQTYNYGGVSF